MLLASSTGAGTCYKRETARCRRDVVLSPPQVATMPARPDTRCFDIFVACTKAINDAELIKKVSDKDKEYHFQNWFKDRLSSAGIAFDAGGRNSYPDFTLVKTAEGYELKALAFPGREADFDSNSQVPTGFHNDRNIFYVFGRYPKNAARTEREYPLIDLVICHGDFLNADHTYAHVNRSFRGFGSYGDILIRDRKMYVAPTPFALLNGVTALPTLLVPAEYGLDERFMDVGRVTRIEVDEVVVAYKFDLKKNELTEQRAKNETAGKRHEFIACRLKNGKKKGVTLVDKPKLPEVREDEAD
jgi:hypothetical protein